MPPARGPQVDQPEAPGFFVAHTKTEQQICMPCFNKFEYDSDTNDPALNTAPPLNLLHLLQGISDALLSHLVPKLSAPVTLHSSLQN
jgi:hypothetical protein